MADKIQELASKYGVAYGDSKLKKVWMNNDFGGRVSAYPDQWKVRFTNRDIFQKLLSTIWEKAEKQSK